ncbi:hypothetical protein BKA82DRAFT_34258 [Pisolithus tinctorius]|uniref:Uncharacterized protein n=1 Tax=Pisolithus tinctorius Marx 270 TaxID=870435 RepID=A0A0C3N2I1_PISTI|nr:hypothetical protein BKA82DRAFT_34258 [Pisolithus tinctorius]KIN95274.1 hypothetical protein M404DRAFT_34258 [Pisolithus tinctorius Marx 270]
MSTTPLVCDTVQIELFTAGDPETGVIFADSPCTLCIGSGYRCLSKAARACSLCLNHRKQCSQGPNPTNALATLEAFKKHQKAAANDPDAESQASPAQGTKCQRSSTHATAVPLTSVSVGPVLPALDVPPPSPSVSSTLPMFSTVPDPSTPSQVSSVPLHCLPHLAHPLASSFDISHRLEAAEESNLHNLRSLATLQAAIVSNAEEIATLRKIALGRKEY